MKTEIQKKLKFLKWAKKTKIKKSGLNFSPKILTHR